MRDRPFGIIGISGFASRLWGNRSRRFEFDISAGNPAARFEVEIEDAYTSGFSCYEEELAEQERLFKEKLGITEIAHWALRKQ